MAEIYVDCRVPNCDVPIKVKVTFGVGDETGFPASIYQADLLAAQLEHDLIKGTSNA